ncbi:MAG: glycosyltransferase family 4 protein [Clostridia bacterium]|nr:glycosyltransferase family 4 protein [Clostridia bacterium]
MKIIEVSTDTNIGGAGKCLLILLKEFDRSKFDVVTILPKNSLLAPLIKELGVRIIEVDGIADKSLDISAIKQLKKIFKEEKPDLVHTHASMSARIAAKLSGCKVVYTRHSVFPPPERISKGIGKKINGFVNNYFSDRIIAVAEAAKDNLTQTGVDEKKIDVILNGVYPLEPYENKQEIRERFGVEEDEMVISIVARLEDIKGHDYFIEAADLLLNKGYKAKFIIAGTGSYEEHLKEKVKALGQEKNIIFTGFITDVDKLMNITDIQANASFGTEATSLALLEGMSLGIPAVVSDFGGNPGVIKSGVNGFVVPKQNSRALAEGIGKLLKDKELYNKLSEGSRRIFAETFTAQAMTRNTEKVYIKVMGGEER